MVAWIVARSAGTLFSHPTETLSAHSSVRRAPCGPTRQEGRSQGRKGSHVHHADGSRLGPHRTFMRYVTPSGSGIDTGGPHSRPRLLCARREESPPRSFLPHRFSSTKRRGVGRMPAAETEQRAGRRAYPLAFPLWWRGDQTEEDHGRPTFAERAGRSLARSAARRRGRALSDQAAVVLAAADAHSTSSTSFPRT